MVKLVFLVINVVLLSIKSLLNQHNNNRGPFTLVGNRTTYNTDNAKLNIYETNALAEKVSLTFSFAFIAIMLTGNNMIKHI